MSYARNYGLRVRIARLHNVFGPCGSWNNGKEKAPAALCRKVAMAEDIVEVWGPGVQTRSFLYIDECIEGINRIMAGDYDNPLNLGSERMISINDLTLLIARLAGKQVFIRNIPGPIGVMGRNSDNKLIREALGWAPQDNLEQGLTNTYNWIISNIAQQKTS
jgi:nucleoside-diphosphate-sugar epimerase